VNVRRAAGLEPLDDLQNDEQAMTLEQVEQLEEAL
jgi:hypothetical protein